MKTAPAPKRADTDLSPNSSIWWLLPLLFILVASAYQPAWHGQMLWDDDAHITRENLRTIRGLWQIWFDLGATQQYYPLVHTLFWVQWKLWGQHYLGYHLLNIAMHAGAAYLIALILRELRVPGALLAAVMFALHPVQVESVAWMTELKNTASGVFYLAALLTYLRFDQRRTRRSYFGALALFVAALFTKSVTATLPAAILIVMWWKIGAIDWRRDVRPLVPFFAIGALVGLLTAWVERTYIGARGSEFELSLVERCLIAGRAVAFYLGKILWPTDLLFIYPRWRIDPSSAAQWIWPALIIVAIIVSVALRHRTRAPAAALLFFCVTLGPALGFLNVYPFRYSFVADHFQYLASISIIALVAAAVVAGLGRVTRLAIVEAVAIAILAPPLWVATRAQSRLYADDETLFTETLARNPECWLAHNRLGAAALSKPDGQSVAIDHFQAALRLKPDEPITHDMLGTTYARQGRAEEALAEHKRAVEFAPGFAEAYGDMGGDLQSLGRLDEAIAAYRTALAIKPQLTYARINLGVALELQNRHSEAAAELQQAKQTGRPGEHDEFDNFMRLGTAYLTTGRIDEAVGQFQRAMALRPSSVEARRSLGSAYARAGRFADAVGPLTDAVHLDPADPASHADLATALLRIGKIEEAATEYDRAFKLGNVPLAAERHNDFGVALIQLGRREASIAQFQEALRLRPEFDAARANLARAQAR